ncbi:kinase [bacterium]|nr:kinase [bacterium]|tara:strand:- start:1668 stop:2657 length:990 start_codon:yes stop_codon:yes gene_type:complete
MIITRTPFRISFFGGGTDHPSWYKEHGGAVISTSIDKYCHVTCRHLPPFFEHKSRIAWSKIELVKSREEIDHPVVRAALEYHNIDDGVEIHTFADLPARSGIGSSSSFTVGVLHALSIFKGKAIDKKQLALRAIHLEQDILKENVGSQDQAAAAFGGFNKITFGGSEEIRVEPIFLEQEKLNNLKNHLLLFFTGLSRKSSEVAGEQIKNIPNIGKELTAMRKMVDDASHVLGKGDIKDFGKLLDESWKIKRGLSSKVTNPQVDGIYEAAKEAGAIGGKVLGAGGGGFMLFFVPPEHHEAVKAKLNNLPLVPFDFEDSGSHIIHHRKEDA